MSKSLELVNAIVLRDDELLVINGGQDVVTCGAGCGVGCGGGCGQGCMGCQPVDPTTPGNPLTPPTNPPVPPTTPPATPNPNPPVYSI